MTATAVFDRWASAEDATPKALTVMLRDAGVLAGDDSVTSVVSERVGVGMGIVALLWRLTLAYDCDGAGPRTMILKLPHPGAETRQVADALRFYEREVGFYTHLGTRTPIASPRCYVATFDSASGDFVLLLEDIAALEQRDQIDGCSVEDARLVIESIAAHHARWWQDAEVLSAPWTGAVSEPPLPDAMVQLLEDRVPQFEQRFGHLVPPAVLDAIRRMPVACRPLVERLSGGPVTLLHGDLRLDNIFFVPETDEAGRQVVVLDWQINSLGRGPYDVAYLLAQSLDPVERKEHERDLVRTYHDALIAGGVTDYSFEQCWNDYRLAIMWVIVYPVGGTSADLVDERAIRLIETMAIRSAQAIVDLDALELMPD